MQERGPYLKLSYAHPSPSRAARYARDFGGARLNLSYSAAADAKALEFSQSYSQVSLPVITNSKLTGRQQLVYATKCVSVSSKRGVRSRRATRKLLAGVRTTGPHACCARWHRPSTPAAPPPSTPYHTITSTLLSPLLSPLSRHSYPVRAEHDGTDGRALREIAPPGRRELQR